MSSWKPYTGTVKGILVQGDPNVRPTTKLNRWWMIMFAWKTVAVFEAKPPNPVDPFFIGFIPEGGTAERYEVPQRKTIFRMLIGREDCTFFIIDAEGQEHPLKLVRKVARNDPAYAGAPLII